jgi:putative cardiolipin synthase
MHNKLLIADNSAVILGGRNIENIYFAVDNQRSFIDNDILAIGDLSAQASNSFETYWRASISVNIEELAQGQHLYPLTQLTKEIDTLVHNYKTSSYVKMIEARPFTQYFINHQLPLIYADAQLYYDIPSKIIASEEQTQTHLSEHLIPIINNAHHSIIIINPYFMPNDTMIKDMQKLLKRGVKITVLTNSLATNDAIGVYAAYSPYQKKLLQMGVKLYELSPYSFQKNYQEQTYRNGKVPRSSLHSKTMIIDDTISIIGSANLDPRSIKLNTEVVAVIYSQEMAKVQKEIFHTMIQKENVYTLSLEDNNRSKCRVTTIKQSKKIVVWKGYHNNKEVIFYNNDAGANFLRRLTANIYRWLPVEKYL